MPVLSPSLAARWAEELPELASSGLRHITFTGGEPTLALRSVRILSDAAANAKIDTAIVTSGSWGSSTTAAGAVVDRLATIGHWDFGYDEYHATSLSIQRFAVAVAAVRDRDRPFSVRVCDGPRAQEIVEALRPIAGSSLIVTQPVRALGRGRGGDRAADRPHSMTPCMSTGPLIRQDGSVAPCCSGLAYPGHLAHPFNWPGADAQSLAQVWDHWREDQLLRLMRLAGLAPVARWLVDDQILPADTRLDGDVCETCVSLWKDGAAAATAREHAASPEVRTKLDELETALFGSVWCGPS